MKIIQRKVLKGAHLPVTVKEMLAEKYILLDSLLLKPHGKKETTLLAIPEPCANKTIALYHSRWFAGHQGVIKCS